MESPEERIERLRACLKEIREEMKRYAGQPTSGGLAYRLADKALAADEESR